MSDIKGSDLPAQLLWLEQPARHGGVPTNDKSAHWHSLGVQRLHFGVTRRHDVHHVQLRETVKKRIPFDEIAGISTCVFVDIWAIDPHCFIRSENALSEIRNLTRSLLG